MLKYFVAIYYKRGAFFYSQTDSDANGAGIFNEFPFSTILAFKSIKTSAKSHCDCITTRG